LRFSPSPTKTGPGISGWLAIICNRTKESKSLVIRIISSVNFEKGCSVGGSIFVQYSNTFRFLRVCPTIQYISCGISKSISPARSLCSQDRLDAIWHRVTCQPAASTQNPLWYYWRASGANFGQIGNGYIDLGSLSWFQVNILQLIWNAVSGTISGIRRISCGNLSSYFGQLHTAARKYYNMASGYEKLLLPKPSKATRTYWAVEYMGNLYSLLVCRGQCSLFMLYLATRSLKT
jgi:hypothetical protein